MGLWLGLRIGLGIGKELWLGLVFGVRAYVRAVVGVRAGVSWVIVGVWLWGRDLGGVGWVWEGVGR